MGFWGIIAVLAVISILLRILRSQYAWIDYVSYILLFVFVIIMWISEGFWAALITFFVAAIFVGLMLGTGGGTKVYYAGNSYTLDCDDCGYEKLEILEQNGSEVITKCKRCGRIVHHHLRS